LGTGSNAVDRAAASFDPDEIIAQIVELLLDLPLAGLPDGDNADHRRNPDSDTQDRQQAAGLVAKERPQSRTQESPMVHGSSP
jgi:hypothetical protein